MQILNHLLDCAQLIVSPNCSERPDESDISLLIIHNISLPPGEFGGTYIEDFFCNQLDCSVHPFFEEIKELKVSAHLLIRRDGSITQFVPFNKKAWHAGESEFAGRSVCNEFSIGIELEGTDQSEFSDSQYQSLAGVTQALQAAYPGITRNRIVGHSDVAPGRKTDPGECFEWERYLESVDSAPPEKIY